MSRAIVARYLTPWKFRREQDERRISALRQRDGDDCRRCRRPIRFDLTPGHDKGPKVEASVLQLDADEQSLDEMYLCHGRCNAVGADNTAEVTERIRRRSEADLFAKARAGQ